MRQRELKQRSPAETIAPEAPRSRRALLIVALASGLVVLAGCVSSKPRALSAEREAQLLALSGDANTISGVDWTDLYYLCVLRSKQRDYARLTACVDQMTAVARSAPSETELVEKKKLYTIHEFPLYPKALLLRAEAHLDFGDYTEAIAVTSKAVALAAGIKDRYPLDSFQLRAHTEFLVHAEAVNSIAYHFMGDEQQSKRHLARLERLDTTRKNSSGARRSRWRPAAMRTRCRLSTSSAHGIAIRR